MANFHGANIYGSAVGFDASLENMEKTGQKKIRKHRFAFQKRGHVDILDDAFDGEIWAESSQEQQVSQKISICSFLQDVHV